MPLTFSSPLWKRDLGRCLVGAGIGAGVGVLAIMPRVFGPVTHEDTFWQELVFVLLLAPVCGAYMAWATRPR